MYVKNAPVERNIYGLKYAAPLELYVHEIKLCYKYYAPPELSQQIKL